MTTNCLMEPRKSYRDRIYTTGAVGWPGVKVMKDVNELVEHALSMEGFPEDAPDPKSITIGFGKNTVLNNVCLVFFLLFFFRFVGLELPPQSCKRG